MSNKNLQTQLTRLGFSEHEAKIYLVLLELGLSSTGPIIKKTGLHRNIVYETLNKLVSKKLAGESNQRGVKHFKVLNPERILSDTENKFNIAKGLLPQLLNLKQKEKVEVVVYEGLSGFQTALKNAVDYIKPGHPNLVMGAGGKRFYQAMGDDIKYYDNTRVKKRIVSKMIAVESQRKEFAGPKTSRRLLMEFRYLPDDLLNPSGTVIFDNRVLLQIYSDTPMVIEINSKEVAKSYRNYFNLLWKIAKK